MGEIMTETGNAPKIAPDIVWRMLDEKAVLVSPREGEVRVLNQVGTAIWQLLVEEMNLAAIEQYLTGNFDVAQARAHDDLLMFIEELSERGILR
jgi:hypothetical protein